MTILASSALLSVALGCGLPPSLASLAAGIALHENPRLDSEAVNRNPNGTADFGLTQVNTGNFGWLSMAMHRPINAQTITDVCTNLEAGLRVLFVRYNGNPPPSVAAAYSTRALDSARSADALRVADISATTPVFCPEPDPTGWHITARVPGCPPADDRHTVPKGERP
jgi:hypothetical protein